MANYENFPKEVENELEYYVYRLIDPRNGETFYVGKGKGNRVFAHAADALAASDRINENDDEQGEKLSRIRDIHLSGLAVVTVIHRHGIKDEATAYEVEAALIDAYPGLTNAQGGHGSDDRGPMHTKEIISKYQALEADLSKFKDSLIIKTTSQRVYDCGGSIYEAVHYAWKLDRKLLNENTVPYVFAVINGIIKGVYKVNEWYLVPELNGRLAFNGEIASELEDFIDKRIPVEYRRKGQASPTLYIR